MHIQPAPFPADSMARAKHERDDSLPDQEHPQKRQTIGTRLPHNPLPAATSNRSASIQRLNEKYLARFEQECRNAMKDDLEVDLKPLFQSYAAKYSRMREVVNARWSQPVQGR